MLSLINSPLNFLRFVFALDSELLRSGFWQLFAVVLISLFLSELLLRKQSWVIKILIAFLLVPLITFFYTIIGIIFFSENIVSVLNGPTYSFRPINVIIPGAVSFVSILIILICFLILCLLASAILSWLLFKRIRGPFVLLMILVVASLLLSFAEWYIGKNSGRCRPLTAQVKNYGLIECRTD